MIGNSDRQFWLWMLSKNLEIQRIALTTFQRSKEQKIYEYYLWFKNEALEIKKQIQKYGAH